MDGGAAGTYLEDGLTGNQGVHLVYDSGHGGHISHSDACLAVLGPCHLARPGQEGRQFLARIPYRTEHGDGPPADEVSFWVASQPVVEPGQQDPKGDRRVVVTLSSASRVELLLDAVPQVTTAVLVVS